MADSSSANRFLCRRQNQNIAQNTSEPKMEQTTPRVMESPVLDDDGLVLVGVGDEEGWAERVRVLVMVYDIDVELVSPGSRAVYLIRVIQTGIDKNIDRRRTLKYRGWLDLHSYRLIHLTYVLHSASLPWTKRLGRRPSLDHLGGNDGHNPSGREDMVFHRRWRRK
jgi:hypothetical protein